MTLPEIEQSKTGPCARCGERPGTVPWGDALALTHGWQVLWCQTCVYTRQLEHARERAAKIPYLEQKLAHAVALNV